MYMDVIRYIVSSLFLFCFSVAFGHTQLVSSPHADDPNPGAFNSPIPRMDSDTLKNPAPCGNDGGKQAPKKVYVKGSTITINFKETINHTGVFRIDFSSDNDQTFTRLINDFNDPADAGIVRQVGKLYQVDVTLPDIECANCTIRVTQSMGALGDGDDYFSCADIQLVADAGGLPPSPPTMPPETQPPQGGQNVTDLSSTAQKPEMGGCGMVSVNSGPPQPPHFLLMLLFFIPLVMSAWMKQRQPVRIKD